MDVAKAMLYVKKLAVPVLMVLLGLILVVSPDTAAALIGKVLGWCCVLGALACGFGFRAGAGRGNAIGGILLGAAGVWLLVNPLFLAKILGRVLGLLLGLQGVRDLKLNMGMHGGRFVPTAGTVLAGLTVLLGVVLILMPLTTSRLVFTVIGALLMVLGIGDCADRLRSGKRLDAGDDGIIDVEKL